MKQAKLLLFAFLLITTINGRAQFTAVPAAGVQKSPGHYIGEKYGGGIVFYITPDALHGLVAETQDQGNVNWYSAQDAISTAENHSAAGKNFTDWRLPTRNELNLLYVQKDIVGGFIAGYHWSSSEFDEASAWGQYFSNGSQGFSFKNGPNHIHAVRAFLLLHRYFGNFFRIK